MNLALYYDFREYTLDVESKFNADKKRLDRSYDDAINGLSECEIREIYVSMYRKSTIVSVYSFLENSLNNLCRNLCAKYGYPVTLVDLKGERIVRAKDYLEKLAKVDFSIPNGKWSDLQTLNKIRNCIVHCEGDIESSKSTFQIQNIVNNNSNLSLKDDRHIKIEREYVDFCITKTEDFLD